MVGNQSITILIDQYHCDDLNGHGHQREQLYSTHTCARRHKGGCISTFRDTRVRVANYIHLCVSAVSMTTILFSWSIRLLLCGFRPFAHAGAQAVPLPSPRHVFASVPMPGPAAQAHDPSLAHQRAGPHRCLHSWHMDQASLKALDLHGCGSGRTPSG